MSGDDEVERLREACERMKEEGKRLHAEYDDLLDEVERLHEVLRTLVALCGKGCPILHDGESCRGHECEAIGCREGEIARMAAAALEVK